MLRSLLLKKLLAYGNVALAVLVVVYVVAKLASLPPSRVDVPPVAEPAPEASSIEIAQVKHINDYKPILRSELFGKNALGKPKAPPKSAAPPPPQPKQEVVTALPLKLIGTVVAMEDDPQGSAIIENKSAGALKKTYFVGDEVMDGVVLKTIRRRMVVLENQRAERLEQLHLEEAEQAFRPVSAPAARSRADVLAERRNLASRIRATRPAVEGANRIFTFNRAELISELDANYDQLASNVDVRVVKDANGNVQGVQASNLSRTPLAQKFGLQEGDIVQSVNGQRIDSLERLYDIIEQNQNTSKFSVELLRGGRKQIFTYHLR